MPNLDARVTAQGLGHWFVHDHWLFRDFSFDLVPQHVYAVTGPSGSGKSTLLSIIAGWLGPSEGTVTRHADTIRWVFQNPHGVPRRTALDHVALAYIGQGFKRKDADLAAMDMLTRFHLEGIADSPFAALSGGEAQRLMLARGLATSPDVFLIDEPTAQLDRTTADEVNAVMSSLAGQGIVVIATHDPHTRAMCSDVIDLAGEVAHSDSSEPASNVLGIGAESEGVSHPAVPSGPDTSSVFAEQST
ncbi:MAG: ABC transporter ATP-binding protein [Propionibacteriaceae bacterium]|jgi:ABC-type lipoprotein export system ATPase subunit|nr:ABC transporter ATP-binding protein [Propionibacteriaceae bacterium]